MFSEKFILKGQKKGNFVLLTAHCESIVDLKSLAKIVGISVSNLRFADEAQLDEILGLKPGSVTPLGLLNDIQNQKVAMYFDSKLFNYENVIIHPLTNNASTMISIEDLKKFVHATKHTYGIVNL